MGEISYIEAVQYIEEMPKFTKKHSLEYGRRFLAVLDHPCRSRKLIHVSGTNGKGSVCVYTQAMLLAEGKTVGLFVSPHLTKINERIRIQGKPVSDEFFADIFQVVKNAVDLMGGQHPSYFEFLFAMAMTAFEKAGVEYVIIETGLGGRLDVTNIIEFPLITVITSIGMDHMGILGDSIEEITAEKAGIIKSGIPVIYQAADEKVDRIIRQRAKKLKSPCREISNHAHEIQEITRKDIAFSVSNAYYEDVMWRLAGGSIYKPVNALLALETMRYIAEKEQWDKHLFLWQEALSRVIWEGRMEEVQPGIIVDGAHNLAAIQAVIASVGMVKPGPGKDIVLFAAAQDKPYEDMIKTLCEGMDADYFITVSIEAERGVKADHLAAVFERYTDKRVVIKSDVSEALAYIGENRNKDQIVYCLGSLYLAGEIRGILKEE